MSGVVSCGFAGYGFMHFSMGDVDVCQYQSILAGRVGIIARHGKDCWFGGIPSSSQGNEDVYLSSFSSSKLVPHRPWLRRRLIELNLALEPINMHEIRPQRRHTRKPLRNSPPIIPGLALLHTLIHILEQRRPLEMLMRIPNMLLPRRRLPPTAPTGSQPLRRRQQPAAIAAQLLLAELLLLPADLGLDVAGRLVGLGRHLDDLEARAALPRVLQHVGPQDLAGPDILHQRHVDAVQVRVGVPVVEEVLDQARAELRRPRYNRRVVVAVEEGVRQRDAAEAAHGCLHGAANGAAREREHGGAVAPIVGPRDDQVDGPARREVVV